jgi:hypothetical protein
LLLAGRMLTLWLIRAIRSISHHAAAQQDASAAASWSDAPKSNPRDAQIFSCIILKHRLVACKSPRHNCRAFFAQHGLHTRVALLECRNREEILYRDVGPKAASTGNIPRLNQDALDVCGNIPVAHDLGPRDVVHVPSVVPLGVHHCKYRRHNIP